MGGEGDYRVTSSELGGTSGRNKGLAQVGGMGSVGEQAVTGLGAPGGSRGVPFRSRGFGRCGRRRFVGFWPRFCLGVKSLVQCCRTLGEGGSSAVSHESFV